MTKKVCITGASSGIGAATALHFAQHGWAVLALARRADRLSEVKQIADSQGYSIQTCVADVRDFESLQIAVQQASQQTEQDWLQLDLLINNAGLARGRAPIYKGVPSDWEEMIDTNLKGLLNATRLFLPAMVARSGGHIVNIGSIAGKEVYPEGNVYCGTKHAVDALTHGMRQELLPFGIRVSAVHPGLVETEFSLVRYHGDTAKATPVYKGYTPLQPQDVAELLYYIANAPAHVNIADLVLLPTHQADAQHVYKPFL